MIDGTDFRPQLRASVPPGWLVKESLEIVAEDLAANVIASSESIPQGMNSASYAADQGKRLQAEFPGYQELSFGETDLFGGRRGFMRRFRWTPPGSGEVTQIQLYCVDDERGYTATGTTPTATLGSTEDILLGVLLGVLIDGSAPGP
jgi:hypothetical protein